MTSGDNLKGIYEQYWLHARHQETQRLWFTNVFAVIVAGVFAYMGKSNDDTYDVYLLLFLTILSILGYFLTHAWNIPFVIFTRLAEKMAIIEWDLPRDYQRFTKYGDIKYRKPVSASKMIMIFYSLMISVFGMMLITKVFEISDYSISILILIAIFLAAYLYYHCVLDPNTIKKIQKQFKSEVDDYYEKKLRSEREQIGERT
jgi:hypothetical protein